MTYLYLIGRMYGDCKSMSPPIKIGVSNNPWTRLATIQTSCPFNLYIYHYFRFNSRIEAFEVESELHSQYEEKRLCGEWFNVDPEIIFDQLGGLG